MLGRRAKTFLLNHLAPSWRQEIRDAVDPVRNDVQRIAKRLEALEGRIDEILERTARADRTASQVKSAFFLNDQQRDAVAALGRRLDRDAILAHVHAAIAAAPLQLDPFPHIVVEKLLPDDTYKLLLDAIPPAVFFGERDPIKQNLRIPMEFGPALATRVWHFMDDVIARDGIRPAVLARFDTQLQAHYDRIFGPAFRERAHALPQAVSGGRVMLRRPGYFLAPHRDPKRSLLTCLMYLARTKDSDVYGTQIFRVIDDREAGYTQTYYPEQDGRRCELVKTVPYRANSMLVFLNSNGAHGAVIPQDAPPKLERFSYQFYVGPEAEALEALVRDLPPERQAMWRSKKDVVAEY